MAVLDFSRDIRVGCTVSLAPLAEEEEEGEVSEGEDGGPGLECFLFFLCLPPVFSLALSLVWRNWDDRD